jgi:hypothetical protein
MPAALPPDAIPPLPALGAPLEPALAGTPMVVAAPSSLLQALVNAQTKSAEALVTVRKLSMCSTMVTGCSRLRAGCTFHVTNCGGVGVIFRGGAEF